MASLVPVERIEHAIYVLRGHRVMLDADLAALYAVKTKVLIQAVKRNARRFPRDFMFQLTTRELANWRSQIVTSNSARKMGLRRAPYAFTEQGVAMLSSVLRSDRAVDVNIEIMRAFVRLRAILASHRGLASEAGGTGAQVRHAVPIGVRGHSRADVADARHEEARHRISATVIRDRQSRALQACGCGPS